MNLGECDNAGLFGRIHNNGEVRNLTIAANIQIIKDDVSTSNVVGAFAGNVDHATFYHCHYTGNLTIFTGYIGGMVGTATGATIQLCSNTGTLTNLNEGGVVGGMIGIDNGSRLTGCYSTADITLSDYAGTCGGMVGETHSKATIKACWTSGKYLATTKGGMAGSGNYNISYCYWSMHYRAVGGGSWSSSNTGTFGGTTPSENQIDMMNVQLSSLGWKYQKDGTLVPMEGNSLPSNPIKPW